MGCAAFDKPHPTRGLSPVQPDTPATNLLAGYTWISEISLHLPIRGGEVGKVIDREVAASHFGQLLELGQIVGERSPIASSEAVASNSPSCSP
jgi:hypothetical protein